MILAALIDLSAGYSIVVVGFTKADAVKIARKLCAIAKGLGIPTANHLGFEDGLPWVRVRGFGETAATTDERVKVHFDHATVFERPTYAVPPAHREVMT